MTSPGIIAASSIFSANREEKEKLSHYDSDSDSDSDPFGWSCDYFNTKCSITPTSCFVPAAFPDPDGILVLKLIENHQLSNINHKKKGDDDIQLIKYQIGRFLYTFPNTWGIFKKINNPDRLKHAIRLAATLLLLVLPEDILCPIARSAKRVTQLNHLWGKLTVLLTTTLPRVEEAFELIIEHISSHRDRQLYSLVTETDVSNMIDHFCRILQFYPINPRNPYKFIGNEINIKTPLLHQIMEVLDTIELPPKLKLEAGEHTQLLMKILNDEPVKDWLLGKLNDELVPKSREEFLERGYDNLVKRVIHLVKDLMIDRLSCVLRLFINFYDSQYTSNYISSEVCGLIHVAEVRRIALGSRFISRSHLLWAFYERGYVLPPQIREMINFTSADEDHPPYHIYLVSMKLAEHFSEKVQLKTFIFSVIISEDICLSADKSETMKMILERYEHFLEALDKSSSNFLSSGPKRLRIC